jgi:hypothetical protein
MAAVFVAFKFLREASFGKIKKQIALGLQTEICYM